MGVQRECLGSYVIGGGSWNRKEMQLEMEIIRPFSR